MTKSEALRFAVDKYLSTEYDKGTYQLCCCVLEAQWAKEISKELSRDIQAEIHYHLGGLTMSSEFHNSFPDDYNNYKLQAQSIRFMFAEFLALMWEDEEAALQSPEVNIYE